MVHKNRQQYLDEILPIISQQCGWFRYLPYCGVSEEEAETWHDEKIEFERKHEPKFQNSLRRCAPEEFLDIFPTAKEVIYRNIRIFERAKGKLLQRLGRRLEEMKGRVPYEYRWFARDVLKWFAPEPEQIQILNKRLRWLNGFRWLMEKPKQIRSRLLPQSVIDRANAAPIEQVAFPYLVNPVQVSKDKIRARCLFHEDRTPSFFLFLSTNSFHCFGCQANGNVITFIRKIRGCSFREAVEYLTNDYYGQ